MKKVSLFVLLFGVLNFSVNAQDIELVQANKELIGQVKSVQAADNQYTQTYSADSKFPYKITLKIQKTDKKGKTEENTYEFNLADINSNSVAYKIQKDIMNINIETRQSQKYIKSYENGVFKGFINKIEVLAENIDAARSLVDLFKKASAAAEKVYQGEKIPDTYNGLTLWLKTFIGNQELGTTKYEQSIGFDNKNQLLGTFKQNILDTKGSSKGEEIYSFNWGDLNPKFVNLEVKSDYLVINLSTKNRKKYINYQKVGVKSNNEDSFSIIGADPDRMKDIKKALDKFLPLAEKKLEELRPSINSTTDAFKIINAGIKPFVKDKENTEQGLKPDCRTTFTSKKSGKSALEETFSFDFADINEKNADLNVKGGLYELVLKTTNNQKFITYQKNGTKQNYENEFSIYSDDLESFRYLPMAFEKLAKECKVNRKSLVPEGSYDKKIEWLQKQIPNFQSGSEELKQSISKGDAACNLKFTETVSGSKKTTEIVYEFSLKDVNASLTEFSISGKNIFVNIYTNGKEKIIKTYKDGKPSDFVNVVKIQIDELESARNVSDCFKQLIKLCEK